MKYILLSFLWILWCILHSLLISTGIKAWICGYLGKRAAFYRIFYNLFSLLTILPLLYWQGTFSGPVVITLSPFLMILRYTAMILSGFVVAGSFFTFDIREFAGFRQIRERKDLVKKEVVISRHGFYGVVRHPMYLGGFIFFIAFMMNVPFGQFIGYGILAVYMVVGTILEDRRLERELGNTYRQYQKEVPMFFPRFRF